jgi:UDP-3-O-[3-hydroxymyristoyl] N-acetylglucosamine deacetylase / 3-hydroxyacyl-[acyl-carrier-protein] dehydratase
MGAEAIATQNKILDINAIMKTLPHRYPFLLVDRIVEINEAEKKIVGIKNVTINEPFFQGHFPGHPIMPGVLIIEAMAQVAGVGALNLPGNTGKLAYFLSINNVKFRKPVVPGDTLRIEAEMLRAKRFVMQARAVAKVDGEIVTEAEFMFAFVDPAEAK